VTEQREAFICLVWNTKVDVCRLTCVLRGMRISSEFVFIRSADQNRDLHSTQTPLSAARYELASRPFKVLSQNRVVISSGVIATGELQGVGPGSPELNDVG